jgi:RIO kinase 1
MEFIGNAGTPAPLLKDRPPSDINASWQSITRQYAALVQKAGLVHGDLSEYNILNHAAGPRGEELVIIDVAQSVLLTHPMAQEFLDRDARNLARWFHKMGAKDATPEAFLAQVGRVAENRKKGGANS